MPLALPIAYALMGKGLYDKHQRDKQEEADAELERQQKAEDRAYIVGQRNRTERIQGEEDAMQASMRAAAAPAAVESGESYQPVVDDEGNPMPANPTAGTFKVAGQRYADEGAAKKAADDYNSPTATMRRQSKVLTGAGKTGEAATLSKQADSLDAEGAIKEAGTLLMNGGWDAIPQIYSRYNDGMGARVEKNANGGATVIQFDEKTGKEVGRKEFADLPQVFTAFAARFDPKLWIADEQRRASEAENTRRWKAEQAVREKNADSTAALRAAQAEASMARAAAAAAAAGAKGKSGEGLTLADLKDGHKTIASTLNADYKAQIEAEVDDGKRNAIKQARESEIAMVQRVYTGAMTAGIAITPEQAIAALRTGTISAVKVPKKDGSGSVTVKALVSNGRIIPLSDEAGFEIGNDTPAAAPGAPRAPGAAAPQPAAAAASPSMSQAVAPVPESVNDTRVGMGDDPQNPAVKANLQKRVIEAQRGGRPLSYSEQLRAKQAGII